jgi:hypothetical protein
MLNVLIREPAAHMQSSAPEEKPVCTRFSRQIFGRKCDPLDRNIDVYVLIDGQCHGGRCGYRRGCYVGADDRDGVRTFRGVGAGC